MEKEIFCMVFDGNYNIYGFTCSGKKLQIICTIFPFNNYAVSFLIYEIDIPGIYLDSKKLLKKKIL